MVFPVELSPTSSSTTLAAEQADWMTGAKPPMTQSSSFGYRNASSRTVPHQPSSVPRARNAVIICRSPPSAGRNVGPPGGPRTSSPNTKCAPCQPSLDVERW
ncbi:MAG: hypothetical protein M5U09_13680 [Gammaproteobacteria bacterium]|nr:hypothetical protein [Gammaproteobacteria bacterium]